MSDDAMTIPWDDPMTQPFWEAAIRRELLVQQCRACGHAQFYPRPHCVRCGGSDVGWIRASEQGTVYVQTDVNVQVLPDLEPPYVCALVQLEEGPRLLTNIDGGGVSIGDRVRLSWRDRSDAPPLPVWTAEA